MLESEGTAEQFATRSRPAALLPSAFPVLLPPTFPPAAPLTRAPDLQPAAPLTTAEVHPAPPTNAGQGGDKPIQLLLRQLQFQQEQQAQQALAQQAQQAQMMQMMASIAARMSTATAPPPPSTPSDEPPIPVVPIVVPRPAAAPRGVNPWAAPQMPVTGARAPAPTGWLFYAPYK